MSVITVGTMAFDAIETPFGKVDKIIGGSGTYVAYAASNFVTPVQQISIVGYDFPQEEMDELKKRGVDLEGVEIVADKKSFFWSGKYHIDMNTRDTLITDLNVLADFNPIVPESYQGAEFLMLGNLMPKLQLSVIDQLRVRPKLIVMDTMNFWMEIAMDELKEVLKKVDVLLVNDGEARQLSGEFSLVKAARAILKMGPRFLIIKKGEHGALLFHENQVFFAPALPLEEVFDPTGAGDSFAGAVVEGSDPASAKVLSTSTRVELKQLEHWALRHTSKQDTLVMEASGNAFAVAARLREIGRRVEILDSHRAGKVGKVYCANDRVDAVKIARIYLSALSPIVWQPDEKTLERREVFSAYQAVVLAEISLVVAAAEIAIALVCFFSKRRVLAWALVAWISTNFAIYRTCLGQTPSNHE